jgi:hypothetical protein
LKADNAALGLQPITHHFELLATRAVIVTAEPGLHYDIAAIAVRAPLNLTLTLARARNAIIPLVPIDVRHMTS